VALTADRRKVCVQSRESALLALQTRHRGLHSLQWKGCEGDGSIEHVLEIRSVSAASGESQRIGSRRTGN
jgi:hypothetical protein